MVAQIWNFVISWNPPSARRRSRGGHPTLGCRERIVSSWVSQMDQVPL